MRRPPAPPANSAHTRRPFQSSRVTPLDPAPPPVTRTVPCVCRSPGKTPSWSSRIWGTAIVYEGAARRRGRRGRPLSPSAPPTGATARPRSRRTVLFASSLSLLRRRPETFQRRPDTPAEGSGAKLIWTPPRRRSERAIRQTSRGPPRGPRRARRVRPTGTTIRLPRWPRASRYHYASHYHYASRYRYASRYHSPRRFPRR